MQKMATGSLSDSDSSLLLDGVEDQPSRGHRRIAGPIAGTLILAAVGVACSRTHQGLASDTLSATTLDEEVQCSASGVNCVESKCCNDGGAKGFQCYEKNEEWAECFDAGNCTEGVHPGEKEGAWDASGTFQKAKWSCKTVGEASKPACWSYGESSCPDDRCQVTGEKCLQKCGTLGDAGGCWGSPNCMWSGEQCEDGCWLNGDEDSCSALSNCQWQAGGETPTCGLACHIHGGPDDCPHSDKCIWDGSKCMTDPCSAPGEDCTNSKCCSVDRGGLGMKCVEKMEYYASCMDTFNKTAMPTWSGKTIGNRAFQRGAPAEEEDRPKMEAGCDWAGQSCWDSKMCCNKGFTCNKKDDTFAGCVQALTIATFSEQPVDLPAGWDGEKFGGWRDEYAVAPVQEGQDMAGTSMYCIMAILPDSPEMELLYTAKRNGGSIFGCNASSVYRAWQTGAAGWDTGEDTVINTAVFLKVMEYVKEDKLYLNYDWTVKVDADCVFLPDRLRSHLWGLRPPANVPIYLKNNHLEGLGNSGFLGAIEVFSREAMKKFMDNAKECGQFLGTNSGEDGFFKGCMDAIGVGFMADTSMFKPNFDPAICTNGMYAAYHPIKYATHWQRCWDLATGKICQGLTYDCGGALDPDVNSIR